MSTHHHPHSVCLFGAAPDTGNQGVTALCQSAVLALSQRGLGPITVFDHGRGARAESWRLGDHDVTVTRQGAVNGRRFYRPENLKQAEWAQSLGGLGNPLIKRLRQSAAVLDVSGGDSFSDIYGASRFDTVTAPKRLAIAGGRPLILLPQTYGPYESPRAREEARRILLAASLAYARDVHSFEALKALLGQAFDPARHRLGVDMAFGLPLTAPPEEKLGGKLAAMLQHAAEVPLAGLNISGLLFNRAQWAKESFRLQYDYRDLAHGLLHRILADTTLSVVLVPHVHQPVGHFESDLAAALDLVESLPHIWRGRVVIPEEPLNASEAKWVISRLGWFAGSRMHATIAALSSGTPAAALAYSGKTLGVFESVGEGDAVIDLRGDLDAKGVITRAMKLMASRRVTARRLAPAAARARSQAAAQMDAIADFIKLGAKSQEAA